MFLKPHMRKTKYMHTFLIDADRCRSEHHIVVRTSCKPATIPSAPSDTLIPARCRQQMDILCPSISIWNAYIDQTDGLFERSKTNAEN